MNYLRDKMELLSFFEKIYSHMCDLQKKHSWLPIPGDGSNTISFCPVGTNVVNSNDFLLRTITDDMLDEMGLDNIKAEIVDEFIDGALTALDIPDDVHGVYILRHEGETYKKQLSRVMEELEAAVLENA